MIDTLIDAGPLVAIINRSDPHHTECAAMLRGHGGPFYTTLPVVTEAMYFCGRELGWSAQQALWRMISRGDIVPMPLGPQELQRMEQLIAKYQDLPMDFADASLVAIAERLNLSRIVTVDRKDFSVYRIDGERPFTILG